MVYIIEGRSRDTRKHDLEELRLDFNSTRDPALRRSIAETAQKIQRESHEIRSMRESLVKAHRRGEKENIKDIHEIVKNNSKYQNR